MTTNPNGVSKYSATPDMLNQIIARTTEQALAQRTAKQRAEEWPWLVEGTLAALAGRSAVQDEMLASLKARLAALETLLSSSKG